MENKIDKQNEPDYQDIKGYILSFMENDIVKSQTAKELRRHLPFAARELQEGLNQLLLEGSLVLGKSNRYFLPQKLGWIKGKIQGSSKGYGFLLSEDGGEDIFIPEVYLRNAWHNDLVWVKPMEDRNRRRRSKSLEIGKNKTGQVVLIVERANQHLMGTFAKKGSYGLIYPLEKRLSKPVLIPINKDKKAKNGDKVLVEIMDWPEDGSMPQGVVREIVSSANEKGQDTILAIRKHGLPSAFPDQVLNMAENIAKSGISEQEKAGREDWRQEFAFTIDGLDARDLDDAISLKRNEKGNWLLGVHIADVSHYVSEDSPLDKEAWERGTSVYFPDRVLPMLPPQLSNGLCSLNHDEDRLALSCIMEINLGGKIISHQVKETVLNVKRRLDYDTVNAAFLDDDIQARENLGECLPILEDLLLLTKARQEYRRSLGSIDFDFPETKVIMDDDGNVLDVLKRQSRLAEQMIEESMIAANQQVSEAFSMKKLPFIYRVHQPCLADKLEELNQYLQPLGYFIRSKNDLINGKSIQKILDNAQEKPEGRLVATLILRSMQHAFYSHQPLGHFALALPYYSHFTSPIRRYPDLAIHRMIKYYLHNGPLSEEEKEKWQQNMASDAYQSSLRERLAETAEREVVKALCCRFMEGKVGETFNGNISGVTSYGLYVELDNGIEGMLHISNLKDDYYDYIADKMILQGKRSKKIFSLGDEIQVILSNVNMDDMNLDFITT